MNREELKPLNSKRVNIKGYLKKVIKERVPVSRRYQEGYCVRILIKPCNIQGIDIDHVNVRLPISEYEKALDLNELNITCTGVVYHYVKHVRDRGLLTGIYKDDYGIRDIKHLKED